jgi:nitrate/nitrite transporter NarK
MSPNQLLRPSANMYGAVTDLFPEHAVGRATGLTGVAGGLSGLLFPLLTGRLKIVIRPSVGNRFLDILNICTALLISAFLLRL